MRIAYLSGYEKNYNESLYRVLAKGYEYFPSEDTLEAVCKYIIKGNPGNLNILYGTAGLYSRDCGLPDCMSTMWRPWIWPASRNCPKPLLMYFTYNNDTLGVTRKHHLFQGNC